jgi:hypothetical protein
MKEYLLIFRMNITSPEMQPSDEQKTEYMNQWNAWMAKVLGKKITSGNHLSQIGKVLSYGNTETDGPYESDGQSVAGYFVIKVKDFDEALYLARQCPILSGKNTSVEVRAIATLD